jgi:hypothetical protein
MGTVISLDAHRVQAAAQPQDAPMRGEPIMLLFDTDQGIEQRLAFYLFEDSETVTISSVLPVCAESMQRVRLEQLAAMILVSQRTDRHAF